MVEKENRVDDLKKKIRVDDLQGTILPNHLP